MSGTNVNKRQRWVGIAKTLKAWEIRFIELYNEGFGYNEIRDNLVEHFPKFKSCYKDNQSLRKLVYQGGRLYNARIAYSELAAEESFETGQQIVKNSHRKAAMTMSNLLNPKFESHIRLNAAKDILDRNAGKATQPMEVKDNREIEELRDQVKNILQSNANTKRIAERFKHNNGRVGKGEKSS